MQRRAFLKHAGLTGIFAASLPLRAQSEAPSKAPAALVFTSAPSLQNPTPTAVTVAIGVSSSSTAWVEYGETEALGKVARGGRDGLRPFDSLMHRVRLEGLPPGQPCFYRVHACPIDFRTAYDIRRGEPIATPIHRFRSLDAAAAEARFAVWNDTHENDATLARLMARTATLAPDFLAYNGDMTNDLYHEEKLAGQYLSPGGQPFTRETPLVFIRGNHDTRGPVARSLPRFLDVPGGRFYYSFRQGPLGVVVLDSGEDKPDSHPVYAGLGDFEAYFHEQTRWLAAEINRPHLRDATYRIAFCHIPFWWRDGGFARQADDARSAWHPLLAAGKFAAVISGHTHRHAVMPPNAAHPYAQIVGGGPKPEAATLISGHVSAQALNLVMTDLAGAELGAWSA
jgi:predicted phosphodiesterase